MTRPRCSGRACFTAKATARRRPQGRDKLHSSNVRSPSCPHSQYCCYCLRWEVGSHASLGKPAKLSLLISILNPKIGCKRLASDNRCRPKRELPRSLAIVTRLMPCRTDDATIPRPAARPRNEPRVSVSVSGVRTVTFPNFPDHAAACSLFCAIGKLLHKTLIFALPTLAAQACRCRESQKFPVLSLLIREFGGPRDGFEMDCDRHHAFLRN
jgi:hypothetical protein